MKRAILSVLILATTTAASAPAFAQEYDESPEVSSEAESPVQEASQRFRRGVKLYREGSLDAALAEFNRAYELAPDSRLLYNIGQVYAELENYVMAVKYFRQYLKDSGDDVSESRVGEVEAEIRELEARIGDLNVAANVPGAELLIDGEPVGQLPLASVRVNAGTRRILVRKKGFEPREMRVVVSGGEKKPVRVSLEALDSAGARGSGSKRQGDGSAAGDDNGSGFGTGFWVSAAATTAAAGATVAFALLTRKADDDLDSRLEEYPGSQSRIEGAQDDLKRYALITDGCGALTVIGLAATIYFAASGGGESSPVDAKVGGVTLRTGPASQGWNGLGWQVGGRF